MACEQSLELLVLSLSSYAFKVELCIAIICGIEKPPSRLS